MTKLKIKNILLILLIITLGCQDEFLLETINYEPIMVVDGLISNEPGPYTVKLSINSPVSNSRNIPFEGCTLTIIDSAGYTEILNETEPGVYVTSEAGMQGVAGNNYKLSIITPEEKKYESEFQEIKTSVGIDSIYAELIYLEESGYVYDLPGYQFYIDTEISETQENYYLWNMIETYQYTANYRVIAAVNVEGTLEYYQNLYRCWKTDNVKYFFTGKTSNLSSSQIIRQPLHFVGTDTKKLQERYSLLTKQYSVNEKTYFFWKSVEDQLSQENFLISTQPYNVIGNIKNIENPNEIIFGNFTVASVTQKRVFVDAPYVTFYYYKSCSMNYSLDLLYQSGKPFFLVDTELGAGAVSDWCIDCTYEGGETNKPDFWIDK
jgi:hypothetical protein